MKSKIKRIYAGKYRVQYSTPDKYLIKQWFKKLGQAQKFASKHKGAKVFEEVSGAFDL